MKECLRTLKTQTQIQNSVYYAIYTLGDRHTHTHPLRLRRVSRQINLRADRRQTAREKPAISLDQNYCVLFARSHMMLTHPSANIHMHTPSWVMDENVPLWVLYVGCGASLYIPTEYKFNALP